jgi:hypothetical protein
LQSGSCPNKLQLEPALTGEEKGKTFSRIFGATTGPLEHFLIKRDIMGPCWLDITNATISGTSVCNPFHALSVELMHQLYRKHGVK